MLLERLVAAQDVDLDRLVVLCHQQIEDDMSRSNRCLPLTILVLTHLTVGQLHAETEFATALRIARVIEELRDADFSVRERATGELINIGEPTLPALQEAIAHHQSLEVRFRARRASARIFATTRQSKTSNTTFSLILPGNFSMGSPKNERARRPDEQLHQVEITLPFFLGQHEVTQADYKSVMGVNPSWFTPRGEGAKKVANASTDRFPIERVSWFDAAEFCNKLSERDGLVPYYKLTEAIRVNGSIANAKVTSTESGGYRLPSEAEWEYACRSGTTTAFTFGKTNTGTQANVKNRSQTIYGSTSTNSGFGRTTTVGSYKPNAWGLYDVHGNVSEWCGDWYKKDYYAVSPKSDPIGPDAGDHRVIRGGAWLISNDNCRSATRAFHLPSERKYYLGFRVAKSASPFVIDAIKKKHASNIRPQE